MSFNRYVIAILPVLFFIFPMLMAQDNQQEMKLIEEFVYNKAPFPSCHASTITETPEGLAVAWFGGTHEKHIDVEIWVSRKIHDNWTSPVSVASGIQHADKRYPCWNPVLFQAPDDPLMLFYKVGPNPREWWGELILSEDHGMTWSVPRRLPEDILGPVKNKPVLMPDGRLLCPSSTEHDGWRVHIEETRDLGKTWKITGPLNEGKKFSVIQPSILVYSGDKLQILCRSRENAIITSWSDNGGVNWSEMKSTGLPNPNSGIDAVTLNNGQQLLVYNHTTRKGNQWGGTRSPLNTAISENGVEWRALCILENEPGEYSYPAVIQSSDGLIHITYTWKREKIKHVVLNVSEIDIKTLPLIKDGIWPEI